MRIVCLDLEMNQPSGKIIEIGIVVGDLVTGAVIDKKSYLINPGEPLNPYITDLTGIQPQMLKNFGGRLEHAFSDLVSYLDSMGHQGLFINPVVWGQGDIETLRRQVYHPMNLFKAFLGLITLPPWPFGRRYIDAKTLYVAYRLANNNPPTGGLSKAMTKLGLQFKGKKHRAADDAENTFIILKKLMEPYVRQKI
jgi:inhibitor of KinA sporulation pathway (predicted exonuclease)